MASLRQFIKSATPPLLIDLLWRRWNPEHQWFTGNFASWGEALRVSTGYDAEAVLGRVAAVTRQVRDQTVMCERDTVAIDPPEFPWSMIAGLLHAAWQANEGLHVVDFGGGLGSSYFQFRRFLPPELPLRWWVIEQPALVAAGRKEFETEDLRFAASLAELPADARRGVLLLGSVLMYVENPGALLREGVERAEFSHVLMDRTLFRAPLHLQPRLTIQQVPAHIYAASYPAWMLSEEQLNLTLDKRFRRLSPPWMSRRWTVEGEPIRELGCIWVREDATLAPRS